MNQILFKYRSFHWANKLNMYMNQKWGIKMNQTGLCNSRNFQSSGKRHVNKNTICGKCYTRLSSHLTIVWKQLSTIVAGNTANSLGRMSARSFSEQPGQSQEHSVWGPGLSSRCLLMPFNWWRYERRIEAKASLGAQETSPLYKERLPRLPSMLERGRWGDTPGAYWNALGLGSGC